MRLQRLLLHAAMAVMVTWAVALSPLSIQTRRSVLRRGTEFDDEIERHQRANRLSRNYPDAQRKGNGKYHKSRKAANSCLEYRMLRAMLLLEPVMLTSAADCEDLLTELTHEMSDADTIPHHRGAMPKPSWLSTDS